VADTDPCSGKTVAKSEKGGVGGTRGAQKVLASGVSPRMGLNGASSQPGGLKKMTRGTDHECKGIRMTGETV